MPQGKLQTVYRKSKWAIMLLGAPLELLYSNFPTFEAKVDA